MSDMPNECRTCGEPIGDRAALNVVYFCDQSHNMDKAWCGKCFPRTPCGRGEHGEGCPTQMICEAA